MLFYRSLGVIHVLLWYLIIFPIPFFISANGKVFDFSAWKVEGEIVNQQVYTIFEGTSVMLEGGGN